MDITPLLPKSKLIIQRYGNGKFVINDTPYTGNMLLVGDQVIAWPTSNIQDMTLASFEPLFALTPLPEILLIGSGATGQFLIPTLRQSLRERHIAADIMDTGAACRTYNVLSSEDRLVAAALIAIE